MAPCQLLLPALLLLPAHLSSPMQQHTSRCPGSPQSASMLGPAHTEREALLALWCSLRMTVKPGCELCFCMPLYGALGSCSMPSSAPAWTSLGGMQLLHRLTCHAIPAAAVPVDARHAGTATAWCCSAGLAPSAIVLRAADCLQPGCARCESTLPPAPPVPRHKQSVSVF